MNCEMRSISSECMTNFAKFIQMSSESSETLTNKMSTLPKWRRMKVKTVLPTQKTQGLEKRKKRNSNH